MFRMEIILHTFQAIIRFFVCFVTFDPLYFCLFGVILEMPIESLPH